MSHGLPVQKDWRSSRRRTISNTGGTEKHRVKRKVRGSSSREKTIRTKTNSPPCLAKSARKGWGNRGGFAPKGRASPPRYLIIGATSSAGRRDPGISLRHRWPGSPPPDAPSFYIAQTGG